MKADTLTPTDLFGRHVRYVIPLFQRPYVWNKEDQWEPLWNDLENLATRVMESPNPDNVPAHFMGAIVLEQAQTGARFITVRHVVDGQQRLTTLQLLLDAAQWVTASHGDARDADALEFLVLNDQKVANESEEVFKVWPTDRDQDAFRAAMDDNETVTSRLGHEPIAQAHQYFTDRIREWSQDEAEDEAVVRERLSALSATLRTHLKLVVIDLEPGDNAQVIFETLNHRGTPLLAADLIKNMVFQQAAYEGEDPRPLYDSYWKELDGTYWREKVSRGRQTLPRIDIFMNYWLTMQLGRMVPADRVFAEFRDYLSVTDHSLDAVLADLSRDADEYASWSQLDPHSVPGQFHYRVLTAMEARVVTPVFLWLMRWPSRILPNDQRDQALAALESWIVRRMLCRLTPKNFNRVLLDLLQTLKAADVADAGEVTEEFLLGETADTALWPTGDMVREALRSQPVYTAHLRARTRMLFEALEDDRRTERSESDRCPRNLTVEHIMPQQWREHWNADQLDELEALHRDEIKHSLGNLTLVNERLNPSLTNRPWTSEAASERELGNKGKRDLLLQHSTIKLNADLIAEHPDEWDEATIHERTDLLIERILLLWPRPDISLPETPQAEPEESTQGSPVATPEVDYSRLTQWLQEQVALSLSMSFGELEEHVGAQLPPSARLHRAYWTSSNPLGRALEEGGYRATALRLEEQRVVLVAN